MRASSSVSSGLSARRCRFRVSRRSSLPRCCSSPILSGRFQVQDRRTFVAELRALIRRGQESGAPVLGRRRERSLSSVRITKRGRFSIGGAESVGDPRAQRRPAGEDRAGVHLAHGADVIQPVGPAGAEHAQDRRHAARCSGYQSETQSPLCPCCLQVRLDGISVLLDRAHRGDRLCRRSRHRLAGEFLEFRLGIEQVDVARAAFHEQPDDGLGCRLDDAAASDASGSRRRRRRHSPSAASMEAGRCRRGRCPRLQETRGANDWQLVGICMTLVPIHEFVGVEQHMAEIDQCRCLCRIKLEPARRWEGAISRLCDARFGNALSAYLRNVSTVSRSAPSGFRRKRVDRRDRSRFGSQRPASSRTRPAKDCAHPRPTLPFNSAKACGAVIVVISPAAGFVRVRHIERLEHRIARVAANKDINTAPVAILGVGELPAAARLPAPSGSPARRSGRRPCHSAHPPRRALRRESLRLPAAGAGSATAACREIELRCRFVEVRKTAGRCST